MAAYDDNYLLNQLYVNPLPGEMPRPGMGVNRTYFLNQLIPQDEAAYKARYQFNPGVAPRGGWDGEGNWGGFGDRAREIDQNARKMLALMDTHGVNSLDQLPPEIRQALPNQGMYTSDYRGFWRQVGDFVTSAPFLMMVGGAGAMGAFGGAAAAGGAGAGAAEGAAGAGAAEAGAAGGAAGGTGITTTAAGQTGLTAGTTTGAVGGGALGSGLTAGGSTAGASGAGAAAAGAGALGSGYFGSETSYPVAGGQTAAATGTGTGTGAATTAGGSTALQRILDGNGTTQDYVSLIGQVAPALLGMYASDKQTDALKGLADRYYNMGAPYRDELSRISNDPQAFYDSPQAKMATESVLRRLSATHGNVAGSPYGQQLTIDALWDQYGNERDRLAGFGGLTAYNAAAPGAATTAIGSQANFYNALGGGIADVTTPQTQNRTLAEILRSGGYA